MTAERINQIRERLENELKPDKLEIIDDGHLHVGHVGARDGRGHFTVKIVSSQFDGVSSLARHRLVYEALGSLMQTDIHALKLVAAAPGEVAEQKVENPR